MEREKERERERMDARARPPSPPVVYFPRGINLIRNSSRRRNRVDGRAMPRAVRTRARARQMLLLSLLSFPDCPPLFTNP